MPRAVRAVNACCKAMPLSCRWQTRASASSRPSIRSTRWASILTGALAEVRRVLRPGGVLLARVSAHPWLSGPHDLAFNTGRRWRLHDLVRHFQAAGLQVERTTYANSLLSPLIVAARLLQRWGDLARRASWRRRACLVKCPAAPGAHRSKQPGSEKHRFPFGISAYHLSPPAQAAGHCGEMNPMATNDLQDQARYTRRPRCRRRWSAPCCPPTMSAATSAR